MLVSFHADIGADPRVAPGGKLIDILPGVLGVEKIDVYSIIIYQF